MHRGSLTGAMQRVIHRISSLRIGAILLIHLTVLLIIAAFNPAMETNRFSKDAMRFYPVEDITAPSSLNFQARVESGAFVFLLASLGLSLALSVYMRGKTEMKRSKASRGQKYPAVTSPDRNVAGLTAELKKSGYRATGFLTQEGEILLADKGGMGVWGSLLFHVSLLVLLLGIALSRFASFEGSIALTEGQTFDTRTDRFGMEETGPYYIPPASDLAFRLIAVNPLYEVNRARTVAAIVEVGANGVTGQVPIYVNHGLMLAGRTVHLGPKTGYSPYVRIEDPDGLVMLEGYLRLATLSDGGKELHRDYVELEGGNVRVDFELSAHDQGVVIAHSEEAWTPEQPVLKVTLHRNGLPGGGVTLSGGMSGMAGGYAVFFGDVRRWSQLDVSDDPGLPVLMIGAVLASFGLALRLTFVRKRIIVTCKKNGGALVAEVHGAAEKYQKTFEAELALIRANLAAFVRPAVEQDEEECLGEPTGQSEQRVLGDHVVLREIS